MHIFPADETEEMRTQGDLVLMSNKITNVVNVYRVKERFPQPTQDRIDKYALDDDVPWCWWEDAKIFCVLEHLGVTQNTQDGIEALLSLGK